MNASSNHAETEFPVQKQLEAYNARDIDAFMQWWADDGSPALCVDHFGLKQVFGRSGVASHFVKV